MCWSRGKAEGIEHGINVVIRLSFSHQETENQTVWLLEHCISACTPEQSGDCQAHDSNGSPRILGLLWRLTAGSANDNPTIQKIVQ